jgi:hypothetical protein
MKIKPSRLFLPFLLLVAASGCSSNTSPSQIDAATRSLAVCGPDSSPEGSVQGEVPLADRLSGRSQQGYRCNLELVGQYQGQGASWVNPSFDHCAYMATSYLGRSHNPSPGVQVVDVSNPSAPILSTTLTSPAMRAGTWESLKVNNTRKLLGGVAGGLLVGVGFFDVYDIGEDCAHPRHLNANQATGIEAPDNWLGHEGNWSPDGLTYWSTGLIAGSLTAIDVNDPRSPKILYVGHLGAPANHGLAISQDGTRLYLGTLLPAGVNIYDVSDIQNRVATPAVTQISTVTWAQFGGTQHVIPVTYQGKPYLIVPSELSAQGIHFIDISDEANPKVVSQIQLQIQLPENKSLYKDDTAGDGFFGYEAHYCDVDRTEDPTALACGFFQSGVRVFNIVDPENPHEIAYFNPPAQMGKTAALPGSEHAAGWYKFPTLSLLGASPPSPADDPNPATFDSTSASDTKPTPDLYADWCSSPPRFVGNQLWVTCQDNGFMVLQFTNGVYPIQ